MIRDRDLELLAFTLRQRTKDYEKHNSILYRAKKQIAEKELDAYLVYQEGMHKETDHLYEIKLFEGFTDWLKVAVNDDPDLLNKDTIEIIQMYDFERL